MANTSPPSIPALDHIVLLVPHSVLTDLPSWLTDALTILPGGTHADGRTENKLIVFADGSYIEIIAFVNGVDPDLRARHRWGQAEEGQIVDWALTLLVRKADRNVDAISPEEAFKTVQQRVAAAQNTYRYADPQSGGRIKPDGVELKWAVAAPQQVTEDGLNNGTGSVRGSLPFWCLDRTPRPWRVPYREGHSATHSSGAMGVASLTVEVTGAEERKALEKVYDAILGGKENGVNEWKMEKPDDTLKSWLKVYEGSEDVHVKIVLFTDGKPNVLKGGIGNSRILEIHLVQVPT